MPLPLPKNREEIDIIQSKQKKIACQLSLELARWQLDETRQAVSLVRLDGHAAVQHLDQRDALAWRLHSLHRVVAAVEHATARHSHTRWSTAASEGSGPQHGGR